MEQTDPDRALAEQAERELPRRTAAYNQLFQRRSEAVFRRSFRILQPTPDAEEAIRDGCVAAFRNLPKFRFERPFARWLATVTLNSCRMVLRRQAQERRWLDARGRRHPGEPLAAETLDEAVTIEFDGTKGVIEEIGPVNTALRDGRTLWRVPNGRLVNELVKVGGRAGKWPVALAKLVASQPSTTGHRASRFGTASQRRTALPGNVSPTPVRIFPAASGSRSRARPARRAQSVHCPPSSAKACPMQRAD